MAQNFESSHNILLNVAVVWQMATRKKPDSLESEVKVSMSRGTCDI